MYSGARMKKDLKLLKNYPCCVESVKLLIEPDSENLKHNFLFKHRIASENNHDFLNDFDFVLLHKVSLMTFATYVLMDPMNILDANKAFVSLSLFQVMQTPIMLMPMVIMTMVQV